MPPLNVKALAVEILNIIRSVNENNGIFGSAEIESLLSEAMAEREQAVAKLFSDECGDFHVSKSDLKEARAAAFVEAAEIAAALPGMAVPDEWIHCSNRIAAKLRQKADGL